MAKQQYFWLKLPKDFFKKHYVEILLAKDDGKLLVLFYIWLLTESIDHEGRLRYSETKPYNARMLAEVARYPESFVEEALQIFQEMELVVIDQDQTIALPKSLEMVGSESESASRVRRFREKQNRENVEEENRYNVTECNDDVTECNGKEEPKKETVTVAKEDTKIHDEAMEVIELWNRLQDVGIKPISRVDKQSKRYKSLVSRIKQYGFEAMLTAIDNVRKSDFLQGKNGRNWQITFDWFVLPNNFPKVLEGNYSNNSGNGSQSNTGNARLDNIKNRVSEVDKW